MRNRMRKTSHTMQRKRLLTRQKQKLSCRRQNQFLQENPTEQSDK